MADHEILETGESSSSAGAANHDSSLADGLRKFGRYDMEDEDNFPKVESVSDDGLRNEASKRRRVFDSLDDDYYPPGPGDAGDGYAQDTGACPFWALPYELVDTILAYLSAIDLASVSMTCRRLNSQATADHLWQALVQANVPGAEVTTPYPCATFRELYAAHDPCWFLPKYKIWFCDRDLTGKMIVVRYDERRGCIEGYQMIAISEKEEFQFWPIAEDDEVVIHCFQPTVKVHMDKPVMQLRTHHIESPLRQQLRRVGATSGIITPEPSSSAGPPSSDTPGSLAPIRVAPNRFAAERPMRLDGRPSDTMFSNFMLARPLTAATAAERASKPFPYGNVWPPPAVPSRHRVAAASRHSSPSNAFATSPDLPPSRSQMTDRAFHIRSWMEMRPATIRLLNRQMLRRDGQVNNHDGNDDDESHDLDVSVQDGENGSWMPVTSESLANADLGHRRSPLGLHIGEQITTYATLDPRLYTPTADKPWRGIWVGDYSGHGCEFLLINQPDDEGEAAAAADADAAEAAVMRMPDETDAEFARRRRDARVHRGRLEAIKLTGDPNVPRGEYTFVADDLGEKGFVDDLTEGPFAGTWVVRSKGHVAVTGFVNDKYIESQLLLISHDRLAQYWVGFGHISFFERVDIDKFLAP